MHEPRSCDAPEALNRRAASESRSLSRPAIEGLSAAAGFHFLRNARQPGVLGFERTMHAPSALPLCQAARARRLIRRHELMLAVADEVRAAHATQRFAQHRP